MIDMCIRIITEGEYNPSLSVKLDSEAASIFALGLSIFSAIPLKQKTG